MQESLSGLSSLIQCLDEHWSEIEIDMHGIWENRGWESPTPHFEIFHVLSGENLLTYPNGHRTAKPGDVFFSDSTSVSRCPDAMFRIHFLAFGTRNKDVHLLLSDAFARLRHPNGPFRMSGLEIHFQALCAELSLQMPFCMIAAKVHLLRMLLELYRGISKSTSQAGRRDGTEQNRLVKEIAAFLCASVGDRIQIEDLAHRFGISGKYLIRVFHSVTGQTPMAFLSGLRVESAKRLLSVTDLRISDIAAETGFYDAAHFIRVFREKEETTPKMFRERHKKGIALYRKFETADESETLLDSGKGEED